MDLRHLLEDLSPPERVRQRRRRIEQELGVDLSLLDLPPAVHGAADLKNCEQMFGHVGVPVGLAGPLMVHFHSGEAREIFLPLATTEGALVASVNRGCKAISQAGGVRMSSVHHGTNRSIAFRKTSERSYTQMLHSHQLAWRAAAEETSSHLRIIRYDVDETESVLFVTIFCDTGDAMGMNMVTIAAEAAGRTIEALIPGLVLVTVAGNIDSDKKPSRRTLDRGRGFEVTAEALIPEKILTEVLKASAESMQQTAEIKLQTGSQIAGALGHNLHAANIVAALYLATGQDIAHTVEASMAETDTEQIADSLLIRVRLPALMVGVLGGGTTLPAQSQCLSLLLLPESSLSPRQQLAESIGAAVLAGELSLLAAQASGELGKAHRELGR